MRSDQMVAVIEQSYKVFADPVSKKLDVLIDAVRSNKTIVILDDQAIHEASQRHAALQVGLAIG